MVMVMIMIMVMIMVIVIEYLCDILVKCIYIVYYYLSVYTFLTTNCFEIQYVILQSGSRE